VKDENEREAGREDRFLGGQAGDDQQKFTILYRRFYGRVVMFFQRQGFSPTESHDLAQETFLRVFRGIANFRSESVFYAYVLTTARNVFLNELRRRRAFKRDAAESSLESLLSVEGAPGESGTEEALEPAVRLPSLDPPQLEEARVREIQYAIAALPADMRRCLMLRGQGFQYDEIAKLMKISIETVKARLHRARARLRAALGERLSESAQE
jgi:RNA polymerase sigma-70 factor (ECF subfamily)